MEHYLYHAVTPDMVGTHLHPLNTLKNPEELEVEDEIKEKLKQVYEQEIAKYDTESRDRIPEKEIPPLNCTWGDVLQFSPVHPQLLKDALIAAGFQPRESQFYQIDPKLLASEDTAIYLYKKPGDETPDAFAKYDPESLEEYSKLTKETKDHYAERKALGKKPYLFVGVPHVFHKGSLDVSKLPVITV
jgi:hypothetical protein